jgi:hypothetical protein
MSGKNDLNDILDAALDELDDDSDDDSCVDTVEKEHIGASIAPQIEGEQNSSTRPKFGPPRPPSSGDLTKSSSGTEEEKAVVDMMRQMENLFPSEDFGKEGNTHVNLTPEKSDTVHRKSDSNQKGDSKGRGTKMCTASFPLKWLGWPNIQLPDKRLDMNTPFYFPRGRGLLDVCLRILFAGMRTLPISLKGMRMVIYASSFNGCDFFIPSKREE